MVYSQNNEQQLIINYFGNEIGSCCSVGENDGKTLSNVLACIERGWSAVLIEPSKTAFNKMFELHKGNKKVECFNVAITETAGFVTLYESGSHLGTGDTALLSSLKKEETEQWKKETFTPVEVQGMPLKEVLALSKNYKKAPFDLISIDVEGFDFEVMTQFDLRTVRMIIVETNSKDDAKFISYCQDFGFKLYHKNFQNLIFVK